MSYYPVYLDLRNRSALVVGGGVIAEGKTEQLVNAGARVRVVSPELTGRLTDWLRSGIISYRAGEFTEDDLDGVTLVISATDCREVNEAVARAAGERAVLCNIVDQPLLSDFISPAVVTRGRLQIAISTSGGSPALAQRVKREVAGIIGDEYGDLLDLLRGLRSEAHRLIPDFEGRRDLLRAIVESEALELLRAGRHDDAERLARQMFDRFLAQQGEAKSEAAPEPKNPEEQICQSN